MTKTTTWGCLLLSAGLLVVSPAWATPQESVGDEEEDDEGLGLSGMVTLDNAVGIGSFYRSDSALFLPTLTLRGAWKLPGTDHVKLHGRLDLELYALADLDATTDRDREEAVRPADLMLTLAHSELFEDTWFTRLSLRGSLRFYLPTSPQSRLATSILGVGPRLGLTREFGFLTLYGGTRAVYRFLRYDNQVIEPEEGGDLPPCRPRQFAPTHAAADRGDLAGGGVACGGAPNWDRRLIYDMNAEFRITAQLALTLTLYAYSDWGIPIDVDDYTSDVSRRTNENQRDYTWGIVDLTYDVNDNLSLSCGTSSLQDALTEDGERLRFPWWDFEGPQANRTSLYVDITGSF